MRKAPFLIVPILAIGITYVSSNAAPAAAVADPGVCPPPFTLEPVVIPFPFESADKNQNGFVCRLRPVEGVIVTIDDRLR